MYRTIKRKRLLALMLTAVLSLSLCATAFAASMDEAKASLASVFENAAADVLVKNGQEG